MKLGRVASPEGHCHSLTPPSWLGMSLIRLMAIIGAASSEMDRALLHALGLMRLRSGEARSILVGDLRDGHLTVKDGGAGADTTKTRASRWVLERLLCREAVSESGADTSERQGERRPHGEDPAADGARPAPHDRGDLTGPPWPPLEE